MQCPKCGSVVARMVHYADGTVYTPCCDGISEVGRPTNYMTIPHKQDIERQRDTHAKDLEQPWELRKGEVSKGWQPNKKFIKMYKNEPDKLKVFSKEELKSSGV